MNIGFYVSIPLKEDERLRVSQCYSSVRREQRYFTHVHIKVRPHVMISYLKRVEVISVGNPRVSVHTGGGGMKTPLKIWM